MQMVTERVALERVRVSRSSELAFSLAQDPSLQLPPPPLRAAALHVGWVYELETLRDETLQWARYSPAVLVGKGRPEKGGLHGEEGGTCRLLPCWC